MYLNAPFNATTNGVFQASVMVNFKEFQRLDGVKDKSEVRIGFTTSTTVNASKPKEFLQKTNPSFSVKLSGEHQEGSTDRKMEIEGVSYTTTEEKPAALKKTVTAAPYFSNWLRLTFTATQNAASTYSITVSVEDCGADGTAAPTAIPALSAGPATVTNATFAADSSVYAAFTIAPDKVSGATTCVDNFAYDVTLPAPPEPVALDATQITSAGLTANWQAGAGVPPTSYVVELTTAANNFAAGTFISTLGATGQSTGITTAGTTLAFTNLAPLTNYVYRVRAENGAGSSGNSNVITVATIAGNSAPTLDSVPAQTPVRPTDGARTVTLTGISSGGESGQTVTLTATSSNPAILPHPAIDYTAPAATATLTYDPNGAGSGDVTITVTANDGQAANNTITRTFVVPIHFPTPNLGFESAAELINVVGQPVSVTLGQQAGVGVGATPGGGIVVQGTGGSVEKGAIVWRSQPYSGVASTDLHASIFFNPREIDDLATKDKGELGIGFVSSLIVNTSKPQEFLRKTNAGLSVKLNAEHDPTDLSKVRRLEAESVSFDGFTETKGPKVSLSDSAAVNSWMKLVFDAVKVGPDSYSISYRVEDWGANGTAFVSVIMEGAPFVAENSTVAGDPEIWSAFSLAPEKSGNAHLYLDEWQTVAGENPPGAPTATNAVQVTSNSFLAKWQASPGVYATGWVLEVSKGGDNFAPGTLLTAHGLEGQTSGIVVAGSAARQQRIENLLPSGEYVYRVRAANAHGASANSNAVTVTTLAPGVNSAPTLDAIADTPPLNINASQQVVTLTGISAGGEVGQSLTVTATSSNPALVPDPFVDYLDPDEAGILYFTPTSGESGTAVITVTVDDGEPANNLVTRTFTVTITEPQTLIGFNDASSLDRLSVSTFNNAAIGFNSTAGVSGGGGAVFLKAGAIESVGVVFRDTAYDATVSPWMKASIFLNAREIVNLTSGKDKAELRFGFVSTNAANSAQPKDSISKTNPSLSFNFKAEHEFNKPDKDRKLEVELASFNGVNESKGSKVGALHAAALSNWLQLNFYAIRGGPDQYYLTFDVLDYGANGTSAPTVVLSGGPFLAANPAMFADTSIYAGYSITTEASSTKQVYFDNYEVVVNTTSADAPLPLAASNVRARQFTAEWAQALIGLAAEGYVLDVSKLADNFAPGTLLNAAGQGGQLNGININSALNTTQTIAGLQPNTSYIYRVRAKRGSELSMAVGAAYVTTLATDLQHWRETNFPGQTDNLTVSGPDADPDGDGIRNLMEYALGMDPNVSSRQGLPVYDASGEYLSITFVRRVGAPDVLYLPESGGDLSEGFGPDVTEVYASPENSDGLQTVFVEDNTPIDAAACRFMRLKLQSIP